MKKNHEVIGYSVSKEDKKHIARLQALRETGAFNMATELRYGLNQIWPEDGHETYKWAMRENPEYYSSGNWVDVDISEI